MKLNWSFLRGRVGGGGAKQKTFRSGEGGVFFQRNVQHSIQMPDITKGNQNVRFILGNTGQARRRLTVTPVRLDVLNLSNSVILFLRL